MAQGGGIGIGLLTAAGIGILALANCSKSLKLKLKALAGGIVFMLGPVIGGQMEEAMPALSATSNWNASYNTGLKTGADVWEQGEDGCLMSPNVYFALYTHTFPDHSRVGYPGSYHSLCPQGCGVRPPPWPRPVPRPV